MRICSGGRRGRRGTGMRRMSSRAAHGRFGNRMSRVASAGGHPRRVCSSAWGHYRFSGHDRDVSGDSGQSSCQSEFERFHYSLRILSFVSFVGRRMTPFTTAYPSAPEIPRTILKFSEAIRKPQRNDDPLGSRRTGRHVTGGSGAALFQLRRSDPEDRPRITRITRIEGSKADQCISGIPPQPSVQEQSEEAKLRVLGDQKRLEEIPGHILPLR